ncbi:MAG: F0F1 ATP synthase subunit delta [Minisyncoccia bacterium]
MIKSKQLAQALFELSEENTEGLDQKFFSFIEKRNLKGQMNSVLYHLERITEQDKEKKGIQIETAHEIKSETAKQIKSFLKADHLTESLKIKKELVAGFRAKFGGKIYDSSIMTGLKKLEKTITS